MKELAPIVLFTYNRLNHTMQTLQALSNNALSKQSKLIIYSDGAKENATKEDIKKIDGVREYLNLLVRQNKILSRFRDIEIVCRERNFGLADSIIDGVTSAMKQYKRAIILEDDIIVSPIFLQFMNETLNFYENKNKVWSISAWSPPIDNSGLSSCYFFRVPHCWGWASWADRWEYYKRDVEWALQSFTNEDIKYINLEDAANYWEQLLLNKSGKIKTWAIFHYLISYKHKALSLLPSHSLVKQIGFDSSGTHCGWEDNVFNSKTINTELSLSYPEEIIESNLAFTRIKDFHLANNQRTLTKSIARMPKKLTNSLKKRLQLIQSLLNTNMGGGGANPPKNNRLHQ